MSDWEDAPGQWEDAPPQKLSRGAIHSKIISDPITQGALDPTSGMSMGQKVAAGAGKFVADVGRGVAQWTPWGPSRQEIEEVRTRDNPLMGNPAGFLGNIGGGALGMVPLSFIPGANTVAGSVMAGGLMGAAQPVGEGESRLLNTAVGAGTAGVLKVGLDKLGQFFSNRAAAKAGELASEKSRNAVRDATISEVRQAGYVTPPSATGGGFVTKRLESIGGKAAVGQEASMRNQEVTNALAKKALGLADDAPLTEGTLTALRNKAAAPYREAAAIDKAVASDIEALKEARHQATAYFKHYNVSADPKSLAEARKNEALATRLEGYIEDAAKNAGKSDLIQRLRDARRLIAKSYDVEKSLNVATGDVSARVLGSMLDKGRPLTGELKTIGKFAEAFPAYAREAPRIPTPGVSKSEALSSALLGSVGGWPAAALPLLSTPARSIALSKIAQATPSYNVPLSTRLASDVTNSRLVQGALPLSAVPAMVGIAEQ